MEVYELQARYDRRQSFYGKAQVIENGRTIKLQSYDTIVAVFSKKKQSVKVNGYYSPTTARHINEFLYQNNFDKLTKKEMEKQPVLTLN